MRNSIAICLMALVAVTACSPKKAESVKLKEGTPAYQLAKDLAAKLPSLDPATNSVLVQSKRFDITSGAVLQVMQDNFGNRLAQLKDIGAEQLKTIIERSALQLGEQKLLLDEAAKAKTVVPEGEFDKALQLQYEQAGGEEAFLEALKTNGIAIEHVKKSIQEQLLLKTFVEGVIAKETVVKPEEIEKAYAEDKTASVRHILRLTQGKNEQEKAEILKTTEGILARAKAGEDFAALAKEFSEDPGSKDNGGLYEDFGRGAMVKPFEDASFSIPVGQISGIVETAYGYHIIQVVNRKKETRPLDEVRAEIEEQLKLEKQNGAFESYMTRLKEKTGFKTVDF